MPRFYYVPAFYDPNTAATNRSLSFIKGFSELGVQTKVVFFRPNYNYDHIKDSFPNIDFIYYWDSCYLNKSFLKYISLFFYYFKFLLTLKKGDTVLSYGNADLWSFILRFKKGIRLFVEYTEHPEVTGIGGRFLTPSLESFYYLLNKVDGLFVITTALRDFFISKGVQPHRISIINITVDPHRFENLSKDSNVEPYIGYCGVVSNNKDGVNLLIQSFSKVVKFFPNIKLYIAGKILYDEDRVVITKMIQSLSLENNILFKGVLSALEMPQFLCNAKVLVLNRPNNLQARNGFATKLGEYLLSEVPVVVTDVGDFHLFLKDGDSALLSNPDFPNQFAEKILWVLSNECKAKIIGKKGADIAKHHFSYLAVVSNIIQKMNLK